MDRHIGSCTPHRVLPPGRRKHSRPHRWVCPGAHRLRSLHAGTADADEISGLGLALIGLWHHQCGCLYRHLHLAAGNCTLRGEPAVPLGVQLGSSGQFPHSGLFYPWLYSPHHSQKREQGKLYKYGEADLRARGMLLPPALLYRLWWLCANAAILNRVPLNGEADSLKSYFSEESWEITYIRIVYVVHIISITPLFMIVLK